MSNPTADLNNSPVALVTGGAQGIGLGICRYLLDAGWRVVMVDVDQEALSAREDEAGRERLLVLATDVADEDAVAALFTQVEDHFGRLDALVNNAGIANPAVGPLENLALKDWQRLDRHQPDRHLS